jgi:hypothetical protein
MTVGYRLEIQHEKYPLQGHLDASIVCPGPRANDGLCNGQLTLSPTFDDLMFSLNSGTPSGHALFSPLKKPPSPKRHLPVPPTAYMNKRSDSDAPAAVTTNAEHPRRPPGLGPLWSHQPNVGNPADKLQSRGSSASGHSPHHSSRSPPHPECHALPPVMLHQNMSMAPPGCQTAAHRPAPASIGDCAIRAMSKKARKQRAFRVSPFGFVRDVKAMKQVQDVNLYLADPGACTWSTA